MYRGRHLQGTEVPLSVQCVATLGVPVNPDACPTVEVWSGATLVHLDGVPPANTDREPGYFLLPLYLDESYPPGRYEVVFRWASAAFAYHGVQIDHFEVTAGGSADGTTVAMYFFPTPRANYLIRQTDAGKLIRGKNPYV